MRRRFFLFILFVSLLCVHCKDDKQKHASNPITKKEVSQFNFNEPEIRQSIANELPTDLDSNLIKAWQPLLAQNQYRFLLKNKNDVQQIESAFANATQHGFGNFFNQDAKLSKSLLNAFERETMPQNLPAKEINLRLAAIRYQKAMQFGLINPTEIFTSNFFFDVPQPDSTWYSNALKANGETIATTMPNHILYKPLQLAYRNYVSTMDTSFTKLPVLPKKVIELNDRYSGAPLLRQKFNLPAVADTLPNVHQFDAQLVEALKQYQASYGLKTDGVLGPATLGLLNTTPKEIQQIIELNLERMRWPLVSDYTNLLLVNIPEYRLRVIENGKQVQSHSVAVGLANGRHHTPEFLDTMKYVVVNPKWYLPTSIATREVLPNAQIDPSYLTRNNYEVYSGNTQISPYDVDWTQYGEGNFPYRFVQSKGAGNALGRIKFLFPNKYAIYLHDTPAKYVFKRDKRAVSHGCVRVENPFELGDFLMDGNSEYFAAKEDSETVRFTVEKAYPVLLAYYTAWANNGEIQYRADVYKRNSELNKQFQALIQ